MNEVFEVLMYVFEKHMSNDCQIQVANDILENELKEVGFPPEAIHKALNWLYGLLASQKTSKRITVKNAAIRVYIPHECLKLDEECRGFLLSLEQIGILNPTTREMIIDRLLALETEDISLPEVKWVTLMVLSGQPDQAAALACMERLILSEEIGVLH